MNKSWRQHPTRHQLYGHLPPITKTIQVRRTGHAGHCWRSKDELISDVLLWTPTHGRTKAGRPARTYIQQLCEETGFCPEDLPGAMNDREKWRERVRDIRATSTTWWWWWWWRKELEDSEFGGRVEPSKLLHYWERLEYWEESWRLEETCCHSNSSERSSANPDVENSPGVNNNNKSLNIFWLNIWYNIYKKYFNSKSF